MCDFETCRYSWYIWYLKPINVYTIKLCNSSIMLQAHQIFSQIQPCKPLWKVKNTDPDQRAMMYCSWYAFKSADMPLLLCGVPGSLVVRELWVCPWNIHDCKVLLKKSIYPSNVTCAGFANDTINESSSVLSLAALLGSSANAYSREALPLAKDILLAQQSILTNGSSSSDSTVSGEAFRLASKCLILL